MSGMAALRGGVSQWLQYFTVSLHQLDFCSVHMGLKKWGSPVTRIVHGR